MWVLGVAFWDRITHPWTYNDDYNGAFWSQAARNFSHAGFFSTAGVPAPLYFGAPPIPADALYVHHPTLLSAMMLLDRTLLGESEWAARLLPILFSLLTGVLLWVFAFRSSGQRLASFALAFFVAAPMELHYGQMVNFEAPELFLLLGALCCFHLWRERRGSAMAAGCLLFCVLAMWMDWPGYLLVIWLAAQSIVGRIGRSGMMASALVLAACLCGGAFLAQIRLAAPGAWAELFHAFRERSGHGDLSGGSFTTIQWLRTEWEYITTLFHPAALLLAVAGSIVAFVERDRLAPREAALVQIGATLFFIDAFYVCALRNQSYVHDFACFYFLIPIAIFPAFLIDRSVRAIQSRWPLSRASGITTMVSAILACALLASGVRSLRGIDTQFCILGDDDSEPPALMPDLGRLIDQDFPSDSVVICNFDPYYSPLPYYARRVMVNDLHTYADWQGAISEAKPQPAAGILWAAAPDASNLLQHLPRSETLPVSIDGIPFILWRPHHS